ncbi:MAG: diguanylate cyclase (GGDEF)-like protein/PAS domain S-box-containing protein [Gammaproteobacteria bacterium]|jgi:diguanylate cyclase (GGDEF)-like protein/PAS domain S-box-containing protein
MKNCKVLLVEDIESEAKLVRKHLKLISGWRFSVDHHDRLDSAIAQIPEHDYDIVLLDLNLPDGAGIEVCQRMLAAAPNIPVVVLTNQNSDELGTKAMREGAQDYLIKREVDGPLLGRAIRYAIERQKTEQALRESEQRYSLAVAGANDGVWDWSLNDNVVYFSPRWKAILGYADREITDRIEEWFERIDQRDRDLFDDELSRHLRGESAHFECEYRVVSRGDEIRWVLSRGLAVRDELGQASRIAGSMTDITRRKQTEARLLHEAMHDALTGLPNRNLFVDRLDLALRRYRRDAGRLFGVLFFDLDRFKHVNDSLGHAVGDELLCQIALRLTNCLRPGDTLARLGGDEFGIVLNDIDGPTDAIYVVDRLQEALSHKIEIETHTIYTTASIGIAICSDLYGTSDEIVRDADIAMYRAKNSGHATYAVFDTSMHDQAMLQHRMETDLRRALERAEFEVYYQPIIEMSSGRLQAFEALLRWQHPSRGLIMPDDFIGLVEETNLVVPIGWWVIERAANQLATWQRLFPLNPPLAMSVNVSGKLFFTDDMAKRLAVLIEDCGIPRGSLRLEITERVVMDHEDLVLSTLADLRDIGVELHIDDFGTGYSSLSYLQRFKYDSLKIDRSFVSTMSQKVDSSAIVEAIIKLGATLGMKVIAEGVETQEQLSRLRAMDCPEAQGYLFSEPLHHDAVNAFIQAGTAAVEMVKAH